MPLVSSQFDFDGNPEFWVPGMDYLVNVSLKNLKKQPLTKGVTGELSLTKGNQAATISPHFLAWEEILPNQSMLSTAPFKLSVLPNAVCGEELELKLALKSSLGNQDIYTKFRNRSVAGGTGFRKLVAGFG